MDVTLPKTYEDFKEAMCKGHSSIPSFEEYSPKQKLIHTYSSPSLKTGRPLNNAMIVMAGQVGKGKSTTVRCFFNDQSISSGHSSKTLELNQYGALLNVPVKEGHHEVKLSAYISFIDMPGALDPDPAQEERNLARIRHCRDELLDLQRRKKNVMEKMVSQFELRQEVYPNIVLFVVSATDERMSGPQSDLRKSLKYLNICEFVDRKYHNLIVVVTRSLEIPEEGFPEKATTIETRVKEAVQEIIGISSVPVVLIDNSLSLRGFSDVYSYEFPNGKTNYLCLKQEMDKLLKANDDFLAHLLISWYFDPGCPQKEPNQGIPLNEALLMRLPEPHEVEAARDSLQSIGLPTSSGAELTSVPQKLIGYTWCPKTERTKYTDIMDRKKKKAVRIRGKSYMAPANLEVSTGNEEVWAETLLCDSKEEYEKRKAESYGLGAMVKLVLDVSLTRTWSFSSKVDVSKILVIFQFQYRLGYFKVRELESSIPAELNQALQRLPAKFDRKENGQIFNQFLDKWGTHVIVGVPIGGSLEILGEIRADLLSWGDLQKLGGEVSAEIKRCFTPSFSGSFENGASTKISSMLHHTNFNVVGGNPLLINWLSKCSEITPDVMSEWLKSVEIKPAELKYPMKLVPIYTLNDAKGSLREATVSYLDGTLFGSVIDNVITKTHQQVISAHSSATQAAAASDGGCFSSDCWVTSVSGQQYVVTELNPNGHLLTLDLDDMNFLETRFCTYLHADSNIHAQFVVLNCKNGTELKVTQEHLVFYLQGRVPKAIPAKFIQTGMGLIHVGKSNQITKQVVVKVSTEIRRGVYAPLTQQGTLLVNGYLVSCYSEVTSHTIAHMAMYPLVTWHRILCTPKLRKSGQSESPLPGITNWRNGAVIHPYAKMLQHLHRVFVPVKNE